jgi:circadian clock protein KaiB
MNSMKEESSDGTNGLCQTEERWELKLYIAGMTPTAKSAIVNLKQICEDHLKGIYSIDIIDLLEKPQLAEGDQIIAVPTLMRNLPLPVRKIIGDLSMTENVLVGLNIKPRIY